MKRITKLTILLMCLISGTNISYAVDEVINGINYTQYKDHAGVTRVLNGGYKGKIVIPDQVSYKFPTLDYEYKEITVPVTTIEFDAFQNDKELETVVLGNKITEIESNAFEDSGIEYIDIPDNDEVIGHDAFSSCQNLRSVSFGTGLEIIENSTFYNCNNLEEIDIPGNVKKINYHAFMECTNLRKVTLNEGLKFIGSGVFQNCKSLTRIRIPDSVEEIEGGFGGCENLKLVILGSGIHHMFPNVFTNDHLKIIICRSQTPPSIEYSTFSYESCKNAILYVPEGAKNKYLADPNWSRFDAEHILSGEPSETEIERLLQLN